MLKILTLLQNSLIGAAFLLKHLSGQRVIYHIKNQSRLVRLALITFLLNQGVLHAQQPIYGPQGQILGTTPKRNPPNDREPVYGPNGYVIGTKPQSPNVQDRQVIYGPQGQVLGTAPKHNSSKDDDSVYDSDGNINGVKNIQSKGNTTSINSLNKENGKYSDDQISKMGANKIGFDWSKTDDPLRGSRLNKSKKTTNQLNHSGQ